MEKWKSKFENQNRIANLEQSFWTAVVCVVLIAMVVLCCSVFGNQSRDFESDFDIVCAEIETEISNENIKIETEVKVEEATTIGEDEPIETIDPVLEVANNKTKATEMEIPEGSEPENEVDVYFPLSDEDRQIALSIMACECPYEPWEGQVMVAQCIMDFMSYYGYSMTTVRQYFDGWNPNLEYADPEAWAALNAAIDEVFVYGNLPTQETVLWFYNPNICTSSWHESQKFVTEICCHRFFAPWEG